MYWIGSVEFSQNDHKDVSFTCKCIGEVPVDYRASVFRRCCLCVMFLKFITARDVRFIFVSFVSLHSSFLLLDYIVLADLCKWNSTTEMKVNIFEILNNITASYSGAYMVSTW